MNLGICNREIASYLEVLSKDVPEFLVEYSKVPEMQRLKGISMISACEHTKIIPYRFFHTRYEHSIGVALIIWNFTKNKTKTIAGLFHDIATPSFSHVVDYLHGDYEKQETTEKLTEKIITNSKEIMQLLKRDNIKISEIKDYHLYPIADNKSPQLSADRLEYTLSNGLVIQDAFSIESIKRIYSDLTVLRNEYFEEEIGFKDLKIAEEYIIRASRMWEMFSGNNENNMIMQFWTDTLKNMILENYMTEEDLYKYSEAEIVKIIEQCPDKKITEAFNVFKSSTKIERSEERVNGKYCISVNAKKRYTNPLVLIDGKIKRINQASIIGKKIIEDIQKYKDTKYAYLEIPEDYSKYNNPK